MDKPTRGSVVFVATPTDDNTPSRPAHVFAVHKENDNGSWRCTVSDMETHVISTVDVFPDVETAGEAHNAETDPPVIAFVEDDDSDEPAPVKAAPRKRAARRKATPPANVETAD